MRRTARHRWPMVLLALALVGAACSSDGDDDLAAESTSTGSTSGSSTTAAEPTTSLAASTASTATTSTASTSGSTTTEPPATASTTQPSTSRPSTTATTAAPQPTLIDGGSSFAFTSPTGNIACNLTAGSGGWVSCWISDKSWEIDQPDGPDCDVSDWGNAVDLGSDGPSFPCYTDMGWDVFADPLAYGLTVAVGEFRCESARSGVTCTNAAGRGFRLARAAVELF